MDQKEASKESKEAKPFNLKSFYLDLTGFAEIKSLSEDIVLLGGTLEPFLCKDVSCVITNRLLRKSISSNHINEHANESPRHSNATPEPSAKKSAKSGNNKDASKSEVVLRGKEILKKACKVSSGNCNVLDNAEKWGLEIRSLTEMLAIIEKCKAKLALRKDADKLRSHRSKVLKNHFIKFEAQNRQSRPIYMEFSSWPVSVFSSDKDLALHSARLRRKSMEVPIPILTPNPTTNTTKSRKQFCEICSVPFHEMQKHLKSEQHRKSMAQNDKFAAFDILINERDNLDWYLNDLQSENSNESFDVEIVTPGSDKCNRCVEESNFSFQDKFASSTLTTPIEEEYAMFCASTPSVEQNPIQQTLISPLDNYTDQVKSQAYAIQCSPIVSNSKPTCKRKRSFESTVKYKIDSKSKLTDEEIVKELLGELCVTVSLFKTEISSV